MRSPLLPAILLVSLVLAFTILVVLFLRGGGATAPVDALPRDTRLMLRAPDPTGLIRGLSRSRVAPLGEDRAWDDLVETIGRALARRGLSLSLSETEVAQLARREVVVALVPGDEEEPEGVAVILQPGGAAVSADDLARRLAREEPGAGGDTGWTARSHHGRDYLTFHPRGGGGGLSVAAFRGLGIVATSGASLRRILDTMEGRTESIRAEPAYRATREHLGRSAGLLGYASGAWLTAEMDRRVPPGRLRRALKLLGLDAVRGAGLEIDLRRGMFRERLFLAMRPDRRGLPGEMFGAPPRAPTPSRLIPADLPFYVSLSLSRLDAVYRKLPDLLASATGDDRREIRRRLSGLEDFLAMDLDRDLFAAVGSEMAIGFGAPSRYPRSAPNRALTGTPAVVALTLKNPPAMRRVLARADGLARALTAYRSVTREGQEFTYYDLGAASLMAPAYRLGGGRLVAATSPELLAGALNAAARKASIADREEEAGAAARLPDRSHVFFMGDTARVVDLFEPQIRFGSGESLLPGEIRAELLRLAARTDLDPLVFTALLSEAGLRFDCVSPVSASLLLSLWLTSEPAVETEEEGGPAASEAEVPF